MPIVRSLALSSALAFLFLSTGCAAPSGDASEPDDNASEEALTSLATPFLGNWVWSADRSKFGEFESLSLRANGTYVARVDADLVEKIVCKKAPCTLPESGKFNVTKESGGYTHLTLTPSHGARRTYKASIDSGVHALSLMRFTKPSSVLFAAFE